MEELEKYVPVQENRKKLLDKIQRILLDHNNGKCIEKDVFKMALNIERGIFNYALSQYKSSTGDRDNVWNEKFKSFYTSRAITIYTNLNPDSYIKNKQLIHRLLNKEITEYELCAFNPQQMFPEKWYEKYGQYIEKEAQAPPKQDPFDMPDSAYKCGKCARNNRPAYKTTYYQLQTRSAKLIGQKSTKPKTSWIGFWENFWNPRECSGASELICLRHVN